MLIPQTLKTESVRIVLRDEPLTWRLTSLIRLCHDKVSALHYFTFFSFFDNCNAAFPFPFHFSPSHTHTHTMRSLKTKKPDDVSASRLFITSQVHVIMMSPTEVF